MIRLAEQQDLERILEIYRIAREFMKQNKNESQWGTSYPPRSLLEEDIRCRQLYVYLSEDVVRGVFAFILGEDLTYSYIEQGTWKSDTSYGTIHRIASDGEVRGVFGKCLEFCKSQIDHIRIDTHENNRVMQHLILNHGFEKCGIIYLEDGSPRLAYQFFKR